MGKRRITPEDDINRLAERVHNYSKGRIANRDDFNNAWDKYMGDDMTQKQDTLLRKKVMNTYGNFFGISMKPVVARRGEPVSVVPPPVTDLRTFDIVATQKGRQIFAREIEVKTKYGTQIRVVDNRGRYAKRLP